MKRISKLHFGDMGKSLSVAFVALTVIWGVVSRLALGRVYVTWQILAGNLVVSGALSALYYRFRYHRVLEYDDRRFVLHSGSRVITGDWKEFAIVSLCHKGFGAFAVRLYRRSPDEPDFIELPASDIGLDPSALRFELMEYVQMGRVGAGHASARD
jgi:hypothetical protein